VNGIDLYQPSIDAARSHPNVDRIIYITGDVLTWPFEPASFDLVTAVASLHHMNTTTTLTRLRDLVTPGGALAPVGLARPDLPADIPRDLAGLVVSSSYKRTKPFQEQTSPINHARPAFGGGAALTIGVHGMGHLGYEALLMSMVGILLSVCSRQAARPFGESPRTGLLTSPGFPAYGNDVAAGFLTTSSLGGEIGAFDLDAPPPIAEQVEVRRLQNRDLLLVEAQTVTTADHDRVVACFPPLQPPNRVGAGAGYGPNGARRASSAQTCSSLKGAYRRGRRSVRYSETYGRPQKWGQPDHIDRREMMAYSTRTAAVSR
jgi:Methyltransferase domain